jgi:hypothetical protein
MHVSKKSQLLLLATIVPLLLYGLNYFLLPDLVGITSLEVRCRPRGKLRFDSHTWKISPSTGKRYEMVDDLVAARFINNLDAEQIEGLLGKPDFTSAKENEVFLFYILGEQKAYPSKSFWFPGLFPNQDQWMLEIRLRNGRAYSANVFFT